MIWLIHFRILIPHFLLTVPTLILFKATALTEIYPRTPTRPISQCSFLRFQTVRLITQVCLLRLPVLIIQEIRGRIILLFS